MHKSLYKKRFNNSLSVPTHQASFPTDRFSSMSLFSPSINREVRLKKKQDLSASECEHTLSKLKVVRQTLRKLSIFVFLDFLKCYCKF
jgi:hypothetical protein